MNKMDYYNEAAGLLGSRFLPNVILNWHSKPARKLKGLCNLLLAGHRVRFADRKIDVLLIDDEVACWEALE